MIKDGGLSFETQLKSEFLPLSNGSKNSWKNPGFVGTETTKATAIKFRGR